MSAPEMTDKRWAIVMMTVTFMVVLTIAGAWFFALALGAFIWFLEWGDPS